MAGPLNPLQIDPDVKKGVLQFLGSQPFGNLMTIGWTLAAGWFAWWAMTTGVPEHLASIREGYKEVAQTLRDEMKEQRLDNKESRAELRDLLLGIKRQVAQPAPATRDTYEN